MLGLSSFRLTCARSAPSAKSRFGDSAWGADYVKDNNKMNTKIIGVGIAALVLASSARAVPIQYEFEATLDQLAFSTFDSVPTAIVDALLPLRGQALTGSFYYDSEAPFLLTTPTGTRYNNAVSSLVANFAGSDMIGPPATPTAGVALVSDGSQDVLSLGALVTGAPLVGYALRNLTIAWVEGVPQFDPIPDFLTGTSLPAELPTYLQPQFNLSFLIPELSTINPIINFNASFGAYQGTVRRVQVAEPSVLTLVLGGLLAGGLLRRRRGAR
jgi:hypothetical protein